MFISSVLPRIGVCGEIFEGSINITQFWRIKSHVYGKYRNPFW